MKSLIICRSVPNAIFAADDEMGLVAISGAAGRGNQRAGRCGTISTLPLYLPGAGIGQPSQVRKGSVATHVIFPGASRARGKAERHPAWHEAARSGTVRKPVNSPDK